jgi:hypothetical protein
MLMNLDIYFLKKTEKENIPEKRIEKLKKLVKHLKHKKPPRTYSKLITESLCRPIKQEEEIA